SAAWACSWPSCTPFSACHTPSSFFRSFWAASPEGLSAARSSPTTSSTSVFFIACLLFRAGTLTTIMPEGKCSSSVVNPPVFPHLQEESRAATMVGRPAQRGVRRQLYFPPPKVRAMAELSRPTTYAGKLALAQRLVKSAQYRTDPKIAVRELCEALGELVTALIEREQAAGGAAKPAAGQESEQA